jgi:hypothetical protein
MSDGRGGRRARRHVVVDAALLETAMRLTGRGQSETINAALARLTGLPEPALDLVAADATGYPDQAAAYPSLADPGGCARAAAPGGFLARAARARPTSPATVGDASPARQPRNTVVRGAARGSGR